MLNIIALRSENVSMLFLLIQFTGKVKCLQYDFISKAYNSKWNFINRYYFIEFPFSNGCVERDVEAFYICRIYSCMGDIQQALPVISGATNKQIHVTYITFLIVGNKVMGYINSYCIYDYVYSVLCGRIILASHTINKIIFSQVSIGET